MAANMLGWLATRAVRELTKRSKCRGSSFYSLSKGGEGMVWRDAPALRGKVGALSFYWVIIGSKRVGVAAVGPLGCWGSKQEAAVGSHVVFRLRLSEALLLFCSGFPVIPGLGTSSEQ